MKLDLDRCTDAACIDDPIERGAASGRGLERCGAGGLTRRGIREETWDVGGRPRSIERVTADRVQMGDVRVGDGGGGGLDRRLTRILRERVREHAVLYQAQADHSERADADEDGRDDERLSALSGQGVHSMRREALAATTKRGSPTKPSGTGSV